MSGPNAPDMCALVWCGWRVRTYDIKGPPFDEPQDLLDPAVQRQADDDISCADAVAYAIICTSMSMAREIPVKRGKVRPQPLRGAGKWLRGLPRLDEPGAEKDKKKVVDTNKLVD